MARHGDEVDGRRADESERALRPCHERGDVEAPLRQQVLEAVPRDLAPEPAELGADGGEVGGDHLPQAVEGGRGVRAVATEHEPLARRGKDLQARDVVGAAAVAEGAVPARVVADHPADRAPRVGGRVRTEAQAVGPGGGLERGVHDARVDRRAAGLDVDLVHAVQVRREVDDDARTDGVAGDGRPGAPRRDGDARLARRREDRLQLVAVARPDHDLRHDAVQRGVGAVQRAGQRGVVDVPHAVAAQGVDDVGTHGEGGIDHE